MLVLHGARGVLVPVVVVAVRTRSVIPGRACLRKHIHEQFLHLYQTYPLLRPETREIVSSAWYKLGTVPFGVVAPRNPSTKSCRASPVDHLYPPLLHLYQSYPLLGPEKVAIVSFEWCEWSTAPFGVAATRNPSTKSRGACPVHLLSAHLLLLYQSYPLLRLEKVAIVRFSFTY